MIQNRFKILLAEKETREGRSWSYREIQSVTGITPRTLSEYSRNKTTRFDAGTLEALCQFFCCDPGDLIVRLSGTEPSKSSSN